MPNDEKQKAQQEGGGRRLPSVLKKGAAIAFLIFAVCLAALLIETQALVKKQGAVIERQASVIENQSGIIERQETLMNKQAGVMKRQKDVMQQQDQIIENYKSSSGTSSQKLRSSLGRLSQGGVLTKEERNLLEEGLLRRWNILVVGSTATGKTTLMQALVRCADRIGGQSVLVQTAFDDYGEHPSRFNFPAEVSEALARHGRDTEHPWLSEIGRPRLFVDDLGSPLLLRQTLSYWKKVPGGIGTFSFHDESRLREILLGKLASEESSLGSIDLLAWCSRHRGAHSVRVRSF